LAILPSYQGQKLGKSLMHFGEQRAANTHSKKQSRINLISHPIDTQEGLTRYFEALNYNFLFEEKPPTNQLKLFLPEYNPKIILKYFEKNLLRKASV
jgi:GNAT superfamily N-acetyltransferase